MPVTQYCNQQFQNQRDLDQFFRQFQTQFGEKNHPQFISLTFEIDPVDPLAVFNELTQSNQLNFYFEKRTSTKHPSRPGQQTAIAAIDAVAQFQISQFHPFQQAKQFIQSTLTNTLIAGDLTSTFAGPHFCCSFTFQSPNPAMADSPAAIVFLPRWQITRTNDRCTVVANLAIAPHTPIQSPLEDVWQTLERIQSIRDECCTPVQQPTEFLQTDVTPTDSFKQAVTAALKSIHAQQFDKIVLAHAIDVAAPLPFHHAYSLNNLRRMYPDCYVFSLGHSRTQAFLGASPERLVSVHQRELTTDALAGSSPRGQTRQADAQLASRLLASLKDNHEHQVVVDFISQQLIDLGLSPESAPLRLLQLPNIQHLHTPIRATVPKSVHVLDVVAALHPTPAVAGLPRDRACAEIRRYEAFERSRYAAPIGWVNHRGDGDFAVGIRSAFIDNCQARLFAGAGIVAGSDPDRELAEVQLKLQALLSALV
jgi:menaquinone-specific isochorismate synthase